MNDIQRKFDRLERKQKLLKALPVFLISGIFALCIYAVSKQQIEQGRDVVGHVIGSTVHFTEEGNKTKLQVQTDKGAFWVSLPRGIELKRQGEVALHEMELESGRVKYDFLHYQKPDS
ncbi:hypothetical protein ACFOEK_14600 [Litoribrevibacter euphylliae]|uniref:Uncharacterized protein n=1 Tax=Litoribrevibacter euphylliae TaxID=1834034 RepID=A0ABV7HLN6_9GAMM